MSALISGLVGGLVATALVTIAQRRQRSARLTADGWRALRPGWLLHGTFVGCLVLSGLTAYVLLSGGSPRSDAETQNLSAFALAIGFGCGTLYIASTVYGRTIAWKDNQLRVRSLAGRETSWLISDVRSVEKRDFLGDFRIGFKDGSTLTFSTYLTGAQELVELLPVDAYPH